MTAFAMAVTAAIVMAIDAWDASGPVRDVQAADAFCMALVALVIILGGGRT